MLQEKPEKSSRTKNQTPRCSRVGRGSNPSTGRQSGPFPDGDGSSNNNKETISTAVCLYENLTREHILSRKLKVLPFHKWHRARCRYQKTPNHLLTFEMMRFD